MCVHMCILKALPLLTTLLMAAELCVGSLFGGWDVHFLFGGQGINFLCGGRGVYFLYGGRQSLPVWLTNGSHFLCGWWVAQLLPVWLMGGSHFLC